MRENVEKYIELIIGSILLSLGIYLFVTPNGINFGGAIGIAQIIEYFIVKMVPSLGHMNLVGIINFMINIPLFIMGFKIMNKEFCIKTVISLVVQTITLSILPKQSFVIMPDMLSNCIFGALMCGIGVGLALQSSGCCGGMDIGFEKTGEINAEQLEFVVRQIRYCQKLYRCCSKPQRICDR